ncbi:MAG TPA: hypothetical protein VF508_10105 [Pyrinomonadaceae bacterium]|jgi:hypothetical protein
MRTRYAVSFAALLLAAAFCGAFAASYSAAPTKAAPAAPAAAAAEPEPFQTPFPDKSCPGVSGTSKCCLWQVLKMGEGQRAATFETPYACDTGQTMLGNMTMKVPLHTGGASCDPRASLIPDGSTLEAKGRVIRRADGFGDFNGDFVIRSPAGTVLFSGCIETLDRVGSHPSCEQCLPSSHYEGWMTGRGAGALANFSIRASISARGLLPSPSMPQAATSITINGDLLKCP